MTMNIVDVNPQNVGAYESVPVAACMGPSKEEVGTH